MEGLGQRLTLLPDDELPSLDEAIGSVEALVSDDVSDSILLPPTASQTPIPGAIDLVSDYLSPATLGSPSPAPRGAMPPRLAQVTPAVPKMPIAPPPGLPQRVVTPDQSHRRPATPGSGDIQRSIKAPSAVAVAATTQLKGTPRNTHSELVRENSTLQDEDFPALNTPSRTQAKDRAASLPAPSPPKVRGSPVSKKEKTATAVAATAKPAAVEPATAPKEAAVDKKRISLNTQVSAPPSPGPRGGETSAVSERSASVSAAASFPPLPTPSAGSPSPSASKVAPKTLRLVSGPQRGAEVPIMASPASAASRAMSLTNVRPGSPPGENASDTASMFSASVSASRAGSPPPTRVGTAAVRATTKSQQRKQRKEAQKQDTEVIAEAVKQDTEEHAPVLGRKKKQKKEKPPKPPAAPKNKEPEETASKERREEPKAPEPTTTAAPEKDARKAPVNQGLMQEDIFKPQQPDDISAKPTVPKPGTADVKEEDAVVEQPEEEEEREPELVPSAVFDKIKDSLWTPVLDQLHMLKTVTSAPTRPSPNRSGNNSNSSTALATQGDDTPSPCKDGTCKCGEIQDSDLAALRAGKPVHKQFHVDGSRMLITPNGDCIRGLSAEEESTFLRLQTSIASDAEFPGSFVFQRHQPGNGAFSLIKGRAVPNGRPNIFPATSRPQSQDPIGKLQREDALSYINQYVLPRLNLGATNVGWPKGATVRQDAAAASLNSLAPYFYGPDAAAGVGIYSAPENTGAPNAINTNKTFGPSSSSSTSPSPSPLNAPPDDAIGAQKYYPGSATPGIGPGGVALPGAGGINSMPLMSVEDAEGALSAARKETEKLEKKLNALIKSNKRILVSGIN